MRSDNPYREMLEALDSLDPKLADSVSQALLRADPPIAVSDVGIMVNDTIWGLEREESFGLAIAAGYVKLFESSQSSRLKDYRDLVRSGGDRGTTVGRLLAIHLIPVLIHGGPSSLDRYLTALKAMESKGIYTLLHPMEAISDLLEYGDRQSAAVFLEILIEAFEADLNYNQCQHLSRNLPQAALIFDPVRRFWQLERLLRVVRTDVHLIDAFLSGMTRGLQLLSPESLNIFIDRALGVARDNPQSARCFLSLDSQQGSDAFKNLQVAVSLDEMRTQLNRYLRARTGMPISVRRSSALAGSAERKIGNLLESCSDSRSIFLPDEIAVFNRKADNADLYKCLVRFEAGGHEFGTFDFDLDRLHDLCRDDPIGRTMLEGFGWPDPLNHSSAVLSDLEWFLNRFDNPELAADLFTIFEHGRIRYQLGRCYPGLTRTFLPMLQREAQKVQGFLAALYAAVASGSRLCTRFGLTEKHRRQVEGLTAEFEKGVGAFPNVVEKSGALVLKTYEDVAAACENDMTVRGCRRRRLVIPFNRRLRTDLIMAASQAEDRKADKIHQALKSRGYRTYRADIRKFLDINGGRLRSEDLAAIIERGAQYSDTGGVENSIDDADLLNFLSNDGSGSGEGAPFETEEAFCPMSWYREWNCHLGDYLNDHTCVRDRRVTGQENRFYDRTLDRHRGLVNRIRYSFELLKPEGLKLCRQWIDGDEFDYRALVDFKLDKRAGRTPSERLYLKRLKEVRDVAVLLLVDLSRSTANTAVGSADQVLDVEKEAIVLLSEALEVVGDTYAIAGFSGTGRLGVDYYHIKDFEDPMSAAVKERINAVMPQRNTRMGAAIRHAGTQFEFVPSRVRLLIVLGDGYPNDLDYKKEYAIEDTRRAISELRSQLIHVHAITVNINPTDNGRLDALYGEIHHNIIANVLELPDKLWRIYGAMTR